MAPPQRFAFPGADAPVGRECAIVVAGDEGVAQGLAVALYSTLRHMPTTFRPQICFLDNGLSDASQTRLRRVVANLGRIEDLHWVGIPRERLVGLSGNRRISRAAFSRFLAPDFVSPHTRRALYLDADVLVRHDLCPLFDTYLGDAIVGAVRDLSIGSTDNPRSGARARSPARPYLNSGVLLMDVTGWRDSGLGARLLELAKVEGQSWAFPDQDGLNLLVETWHELDEIWNLQLGNVLLSARRLLTEPRGHHRDRRRYRSAAVLHFTGGAKPWHPRCPTRGALMWACAFTRTGWFEPATAVAWLLAWLARRAAYLPLAKAKGGAVRLTGRVRSPG